LSYAPLFRKDIPELKGICRGT